MKGMLKAQVAPVPATSRVAAVRIAEGKTILIV